MDHKPLKKNTRIALMVSGGMDALLGAFLVLVGLELLPIDITELGFENWHALLAGSLLFIVGMGVIAYNLSRIEE